MPTKNKYNNENLVLPKEIEDIIENSEIEWTRFKEDIWLEMESKLGQQAPKVIKMRPNVFSQIIKYTAVASAVLFLAFSATAALYTKKISTDLAQQTFLLPDKSKVNLHANSTFSYRPLLWVLSRTAKLDGEAYFEVEKGKKFEIISDKAKTVVLGTRFTVTARDNNYSVNCEQGKVMVIASMNKNEAVINAGESVTLQVNNQFKVINRISKKTIDTSADYPKVEKNTSNQVVTSDKSVAEPQRNEGVHQEQNQDRESNKPDIVRSDEQNKGIENPVEEAKNILEEIDTKSQTGKQEKAMVPQAQNESENSNESTKTCFRNSLTKKQIEILEDNKMSKEEKQKAFMKTLSNEQKELLKEQNKETVSNSGNNNRNLMKDNIKQEQRNQNKNQADNSPAKNSGNSINGNGKHK